MQHPMSYSGDDIQIYSSNNSFYVRKTYKNISKGIVSFRKQNSFLPINVSNVALSSVPVIGCNLGDKSISIEMPYVSGASGVDLMTMGHVLSAKNLSSLLSMYTGRLISISTDKDLNVEPALLKINEVKKKSSDEWSSIIDKSVERICLLNSSAKVPVCECHGDLTLSNIIALSSSCFYLIDFSSTVYESVLSDIVKLEQDLFYGWSARFSGAAKMADSSVFGRHAYPLIANHIKKEYKSAYMLISILNYLRIIPYVKDDVTLKWVKKIITHLISL